MILLVDAGNTRIKWASLADGRVMPGGACPTAEAGTLRRACLDARPVRAVVSCVADEAVRVALQGLFTELEVETHWLRAAASAHGLDNAYDPPESLGPDRYAALVAAARSLRQDCVVVSVGTAMTADMLTADGRFLGGCIVPGPELMREALRRGTARVMRLEGEWRPFPRDTGAAVASGIALALLGVARGMREILGQRPGAGPAQPALVLTGGARSCLRPLLEGTVIEVDDLVMEGLACIARDLGYAG
jgi:type III pantothenate kinase